MPFESEKQRRYLFANEPGLARRWTKKYGSMPDGRGGPGSYKKKRKVKRKLGKGFTRDNLITNRLVREGKLPKSQLEIYPQKGKVKQTISGRKNFIFGDKAIAGYAYDIDRKRRDPRGNIGASAGFRFGPLRGGVGFGTHGGPVKRKARKAMKKTLGPIGTKRTY